LYPGAIKIAGNPLRGSEAVNPFQLEGAAQLLDIVAMPEVELSVVMPCLNEAETLATCVRKAVEEQFYLALPLIIRQVGRKHLVLVTVGAILAAPLLRLALIRFYSNGILCNYFLTPCRADALGWGVLCALLARNQRAWEFLKGHRALLYRGLALLGSGLLVLAIYFESITAGTYLPLATTFYGMEYSLLALFYATLLLIAISREDVFVRTVLCNGLMTGLELSRTAPICFTTFS
jgi:hypothetical protein